MTLLRRGAAHPTSLPLIPLMESQKGRAVAFARGRATPLGDSGEDAPLNAYFRAEHGECLLALDPEGRTALFLGLGSKLTPEGLRRDFASAVRFARSRKLGKLALMDFEFDEGRILSEMLARAAFEGMLIANYQPQHCGGRQRGDSPIQEVILGECSEAIWQEAQRAELINRGVDLARSLTERNADDVTPQQLADLALELRGQYRLNVEVWDRAKLSEKEMELTLAVARGSRHEPRVIFAKYDGGRGPHIACVGKGVTFDTGGLCLKTSKGIAHMRADMAGAAAVMGLLQAVAELELPCKFTAIIPAVENAIGSGAYKPGDTVRACNGKWVEVDNTDAEGRLILGEALHIACKELRPDHIIDLATLTGAVITALGHEAAGLMTNSDQLAQQLIASGSRTFERVWRLPLFEEYRDLLKSDAGDFKNAGGHEAGTIVGGIFLREFVNHPSWAHLDIAGMAFLDKAKRYFPPNATGFGVRLLVDWIEELIGETKVAT